MYNGKHVDTLFVNLKLLSKLKTQGNKLYTDGDELKIDDGNILKQVFYRWWYNENRYKTLEKIKDIIRESINLGQNAVNSEILYRNSTGGGDDQKSLEIWVKDNIKMLGKLCVSMESAVIGIRTLMDTYSDDSTLCSKLEVEIDLMEENINRFRVFLKN